MTIAKLRAARQLWARVAEVVGEPEAARPSCTPMTSLPMMTQRDPWVNMLRTTLAAFGAGVGGADTVLVFPFDVAIAGGFPGMAPSFARRMARNTQLLLLEESHVGRVLDPAGGSWFVEDLTRAPGRAGLGALPGHRVARRFRRRPATSSPARSPRCRTAAADDIAHRRTALTGVNEFPNLAEAPLPQSDSTSPAVRALRGRIRGAAGPLGRATWTRNGRGRRCCCCRWARWPSTTSARPSPRTCWPPAVSRPSTPAPSTPTVSRQRGGRRSPTSR